MYWGLLKLTRSTLLKCIPQLTAFTKFKMAAHTKVIPNNCVLEIKLPRRVKYADGVDYNPCWDLYATSNDVVGVSIWNPLSGKVVAEFRGFGDFRDVLFVPGNRIAVSSSGYYVGGDIKIFNLGDVMSNPAKFVKKDESNYRDDEEDEDRDSKADLEINGKDILVSFPGPIALSPRRSLLVSDINGDVSEIFIDWDNLKLLKSKEIIPGDEECEGEIFLLCCSPDFNVSTFCHNPPFISSAKLHLNADREMRIQEQEKITFYLFNGEDKPIEFDAELSGLVHDGQNLIVANQGEIVLLESTKEGSKAHLIASDVKPSGRMRLNQKGHLIVCEKEVIKLFQYKD